MAEVYLSDLIAPAFLRVWNAAKDEQYKELWLMGGRGSCKSSFCSLLIICGMLKDKEANAIIYRKVADTLRETVYAQMVWAISALGVAPWFRCKVSPMEIEYIPTGQRVLFRGADKPEKSKGIKLASGYFGFLWFEELTEFDNMEAVRTITASILRGSNKRSLTMYSYNPPMSIQNWVNQEAIEKVEGRYKHHSDYRDVPPAWLGQEFILKAEALRESNERAYRHMYLGEVTGTGGQVFDNLELRPIAPEEWQGLPTYSGHDFGFAVDPDTFVRCAFDKKRRILYIVDEYAAIGTRMDALAKEIGARCGKDIVTADSAEPRSIAELRARGLRVVAAKKGPDSIAHGMRWLQTLAKIVIDTKRCPFAAKEFLGYEYDRDKSGVWLARYPDKNNHCLIGNTIVHTVNGEAPIQELVGKTGSVYCYDEEKRTRTRSRFFDVRKTQANAPVYRVELANGKSVIATAEHPFLTATGWKWLSDLTEKDEIVCIGGFADD